MDRSANKLLGSGPLSHNTRASTLKCLRTRINTRAAYNVLRWTLRCTRPSEASKASSLTCIHHVWSVQRWRHAAAVGSSTSPCSIDTFKYGREGTPLYFAKFLSELLPSFKAYVLLATTPSPLKGVNCPQVEARGGCGSINDSMFDRLHARLMEILSFPGKGQDGASLHVEKFLSEILLSSKAYLLLASSLPPLKRENCDSMFDRLQVRHTTITFGGDPCVSKQGSRRRFTLSSEVLE